MDVFRLPPELLNSETIQFNVERNGSVFATVRGFFCDYLYPNTIQLVENIDIKNGDYLINTITNQRYLAVDARPLIVDGKPFEWMVSYRTDYQQPQPATSINIGSVNGSSIIGSQQNATINNGIHNLDDIRTLVTAFSGEDRAKGEALLNELSDIESSTHPVMVEGALSKFSDLLKKHTDLLTAVGGWAVNLMIGK